MINFESIQKETVLLNPMKNMERKSIASEIRIDPLTGRSARICHFMKLEWEKPDFDTLCAKAGTFCPFCPDKVMKITPRFPEEIILEGRLVSDDMVLFPNLAPYESISAVATLGGRHYIPMTEIGPGRIARGFRLAMTFFRRLRDIGHPEAVYHLINWNYMPPSGSSLIHPHLQVFSGSFAPNLMREELQAAKTYMNTQGSNYWDDLVQTETRDSRRFLGKIGRISWFSAYAPMGVAGDVLAVADNVRCTLELSDDDLSDIADGLTRAMSAYDKIGIYSFNMNFFTGAENDDHARFHLLFSPRTFFNQALGTPDIGAIQRLYNESVCMAFPEDINRMLKPEFQK